MAANDFNNGRAMIDYGRLLLSLQNLRVYF